MGRTSSRLTTSEVLQISTTFLRKQGYFAGGILKGVVTSGGGDMGVTVSTLPGDEYVRFQFAHINKSWGDERTELDYKIQLTWIDLHSGGRIWLFRCPLSVNGQACNRRSRILYIGDGRFFGCRQCYDLAYQSSRDCHNRTMQRWKRLMKN